MNIIEAIKSGKRFNRKSWTSRDWIDGVTKHEIFAMQFITSPVPRLDLPIDAIIADDWEVEEVHVTITESVLSAAWEKAVKSSGYHDDYSPHGWLYAELKKELGL